MNRQGRRQMGRDLKKGRYNTPPPTPEEKGEVVQVPDGKPTPEEQARLHLENMKLARAWQVNSLQAQINELLSYLIWKFPQDWKKRTAGGVYVEGEMPDATPPRDS